ncbi:hypothetical protein PG996_009482 [Apiospora saccharicola]|uniref:Uncharacterized protein n=1 Tax=Apiospora saccharicola TaxID=335842 RepID=A0ABR1UKX1_9PEZI
MLIVRQTLLCIAAFCVDGVYSAEGPRVGRFDRRSFINSSTIPTEAAAGTIAEPPTTQALTTLLGSPAFAVPTSSIGVSWYTVAVEQVSSLSTPASSLLTSAASEAQSAIVTTSGAHGNLDALTSGRRPPPPPPRFSIITFKPGPGSTQNATAAPILSSGASGLARSSPPLVIHPTQTKNFYFNPTAGVITTMFPTTEPTSTPALTLNGCSASTDERTVTEISVIHTSTITWTDDPAKYTPPFPEVTLPCTQPPTGRFSASICPDGHTTCLLWLPQPTSGGTTQVWGSVTATKEKARPTVIFWTTDKNPVVVFSSSPPPDFLGGGKPTQQNDHETVGPGATGGFITPVYGKVTTSTPQPPQPVVTPQANAPPKPSEVTVVIQTTQVVINGETFTDNSKSKSTTAVVGTDKFTIDPTQVVGRGTTITRPFVNGVFVPTASTTVVDGLKVVYGPSAATIDGTSFAVGASPTKATVAGKAITIGPGGIFFPSQVLPVAAEAVLPHLQVIGGTLITAVGQSVFVVGGTSITYGPNMSPITTSIGKDKVTIGPLGVVVDGSTLGGVAANPTATTYKILAGATVTEIGSTAVVIDGVTYSVGPGATLITTTVVAGQTLTISPNGVAVSTDTYAQPYATTTVLSPGSAPSADLSSPTGGTDSGSSPSSDSTSGSTEPSGPEHKPKNAGAILQLSWGHWIFTICITIGAWM